MTKRLTHQIVVRVDDPPCIDGQPHAFTIEEGDEKGSWRRCRCGGRSNVKPRRSPFLCRADGGDR